MSRRAPKSIVSPTAASNHTSLWPADFASPRQTLLILFCVIAWGGILAFLAAGNSLLGLKKALLILAGARMEPVLGAASLHSVDLAVVLGGFILVAGAGYVHVSLGLAVVLALRPWLDGFTYPTDNFYFLWAVLYLIGLWSVRQLRAPQAIRGKIPLALLAVFLGSCLISAVNSIQFDATYRELLHWAAYGATFFLAINATPHATARGMVLIGLFAGMTGQALFAYPHLWYILPWIREYLQEDPRRLSQWFQGATEFTPELARRFNLNRAFASMVFPNALAALLILGIPASLACAWNGVVALRKSATVDEAPVTSWRCIAPWGIGLFLLVCLPLYLLGQFPLAYQLDGSPWFGSVESLILLSVGAGAASATFFLLAAREYGLARAGLGVGTVAALLLFPLTCGALWITYSRGAMLALIVAVMCSAVLLWRRKNPFWIAEPLAGTALLVIVALGVAAVSMQLPALAQEAPTPAGTTVTGEGMDITVRELANPGSMKLRLGYWQVAWDISLDFPYTGVGLGNFRIAYGPYQNLGAGDVQNAHNALLQTACEVGIPGFWAFVAFWIYFLVRGGKAIRATEDVPQRRLYLGIYCGVMAFLLHSLLDINFSHPSLVMFVMAVAGLFFSFTAPVGKQPGRFARLGALPLLLTAALVGGAAFRPYLFDLAANGGRFINVSKRSLNDSRLNAAYYFLGDCVVWASKGKPAPPPSNPAADAITLLPDREILFAVGRVLAPDPERQRMVPLAKESALPSEAVFQIVRPWDARHYAVEGIEVWVEELERLDRRFPYDHQSAYLISNAYKLLVEQGGIQSGEQHARWLTSMVEWADEAVRRSPWHKDMYQMRAWAYWSYGTHTQGAESLQYFEKALRNFGRSTQLAHLEPGYYFSEAAALAAIGNSFQSAGRVEEGAGYLKESESVQKRGEDLQKKRWSLGLQ